jgi:extradiol dioxygenase family protein
VTLPPFHLSFAVPDLRSAVRFYRDVLGCAIDRDEGRWIDVLMYGHQLTLHQAAPQQPALALDHFGVVLDAAQWHALAGRIEAADTVFAMPPHMVEAGTPHERGKFVVRDPAGNLLEFKCRAG